MAKLSPASTAGIWSEAGVGATLGPSVIRRESQAVAVLHFELAGAPQIFASVRLEAPLRSLDPYLPAGVIWVYVFAGDGEPSADEWNAGDPMGAFDCEAGQFPVLTWDFTEEARAFLATGHSHLSIRLCAAGEVGRYDLGAAGGVPDPTLVFER